MNPRVAFERLFGDGTSAEERLTGRKQNASILDSVDSRSSGSFKNRPRRRRQGALDTYIENIRELERRIQIAMDAMR